MTPGAASRPLRLGTAARALLAPLGGRVARAAVISPLRSPAARKRCYRIDLADGQTVKLRRSTSEAEARQYADLVGALGDPRLARVFHRRGSMTLEEWVPGVALDALDPAPVQLAAAGELLGTLHAVRRVGATALPPPRPTRPVRMQLQSDLRAVLALGALPDDVVARLRAAVAFHDPGTARAGVLHTDLCPENLVLDPSGTIRAIDNEGMRIGAIGFDLARVRYRWPMSAAEWETFLAAYARLSDPGPELAHFVFWQIAAISQSARLRLTRRTAHANLPVRALIALAATL